MTVNASKPYESKLGCSTGLDDHMSTIVNTQGPTYMYVHLIEHSSKVLTGIKLKPVGLTKNLNMVMPPYLKSYHNKVWADINNFGEDLWYNKSPRLDFERVKDYTNRK